MTDLEGVLGLVNSARAAMGREPLESLPQGRRGSSSDCVLARSLGMSFGNRSAWAVDGRRRQRREAALLLARTWEVHAGVLNRRSVQLPEGLRQFVNGFDSGDYPDLVDPTARSEDPGVLAGV
ncbi:MAG TPA: hypothetical protein VFW24_03795 [Acidimicrobiales bacterium]|nr:hypothetical protein [Acidimicrobiales bacterium]